MPTSSIKATWRWLKDLVTHYSILLNQQFELAELITQNVNEKPKDFEEVKAAAKEMRENSSVLKLAKESGMF